MCVRRQRRSSIVSTARAPNIDIGRTSRHASTSSLWHKDAGYGIHTLNMNTFSYTYIHVMTGGPWKASKMWADTTVQHFIFLANFPAEKTIRKISIKSNCVTPEMEIFGGTSGGHIMGRLFVYVLGASWLGSGDYGCGLWPDIVYYKYQMESYKISQEAPVLT